MYRHHIAISQPCIHRELIINHPCSITMYCNMDPPTMNYDTLLIAHSLPPFQPPYHDTLILTSHQNHHANHWCFIAPGRDFRWGAIQSRSKPQRPPSLVPDPVGRGQAVRFRRFINPRPSHERLMTSDAGWVKPVITPAKHGTNEQKTMHNILHRRKQWFIIQHK